MTKKARTYNGEKTASSINGVRKNWTSPCKRIKLDYSLTPCPKINSKWTKDIKVKPKIIKILEENIGTKLFDTGLSNIFWDLSPQARETEAKINKCDYIQLKSFCTAKEIINKMKRLPTD